MPGPAPSDNPRRRNARPTTVKLPRGGRVGRVPAFPIKGRTVRVPAVWKDLWKTPQAAAWETMGPGIVRTVARYALLLVDAEVRGAPAAILTEVRQLEDRLGLTPMSMLRLRWEISTDEVAEQRTEQAKRQTAPASKADDTRKRLRVV